MVKWMCGDQHLIDKKTKSYQYPMPTPKKLFDVVGKPRIFSNLDLKSGYHQLPLRLEDRVKMACRVDYDGRTIFSIGNTYLLA